MTVDPPSSIASPFSRPPYPTVAPAEAAPSEATPSETALPGWPAEPPVFTPGAGSTLIPVQPAVHVEPSPTTPSAQPPVQAALNDPATGDSAKWPLSPTVMFLGLVASLAFNLFLLWVMRDFRSRYRALLRRMGEVGDIVRNCVLELESSGG